MKQCYSSFSRLPNRGWIFGLLAILLSMGDVSAELSEVQIFKDTFTNGSITNSEMLTGSWSFNPSSYICSITESGGKLTVVAGGASSDANLSAPLVIVTGASADMFNFTKRKMRFKADVTITGDIPNLSTLQFALTSENVPSYGVSDAVYLQMRADNTVSFGTKQDRPMVGMTSTLVNNVNVGGTITGYDLTIDATDYTLTILFSGGAGSKTFTGQHGLRGSQWGVDGYTFLEFETLRNASAAGQTATSTIDNLTVSKFVTPVVFEDTFSNGTVSDSDLETGIWTSILPHSSTVTESGSLVLKAGSLATDTDSYFVNSAITTPVQHRFNFFDQQLKISSRLSVTGSTTDSFHYYGELILASEATTGDIANDALLLGVIGSNYYVSVMAKQNASGSNVNYGGTALLSGQGAVGNWANGGNFDRFDYYVNNKRFEFIGYGAGALSGKVRLTGAHGLTRSTWGSNGDSALVLQSFRSIETNSGAITTSTWNDLRVENDSAKILDERFWIFTSGSGTYRLWLPSTEPVIRGIIFIMPGSGADFTSAVHDPVAQEAARAMGFGLIAANGSGHMGLNGSDYAAMKTAVQATLDQAATVSGRSEISNAALCITGFSLGGFDSCGLVRAWPERVVAFAPLHGGEWSGATPVISDAAKKVPGLFVVGGSDGNVTPTWQRQMFDYWKGKGGRVAYCVDWGIGHQVNGDVGWEAAWSWLVETTKVRYPRPMVPPTTAGTFPTLLDMVDSTAWLGDVTLFSTTPTTSYSFTTVSPYGSYSGTVTTSSYLPNETCARVYRAMNSTDGVKRTAAPLYSPLRIVSPAQYADPVFVGSSFTIEIDPREFDNTNAIASVDFYDGDQFLGTDSSGPLWQWVHTPTTAGYHSYSVIATDVLGNKRDAFRTLPVYPVNYPPVAYRKSLSCVAAALLTGTVSGLDPEGNTVTYAIVQQPSHGTATLNATTGAYTYVSNPGYGGTDSFTFTTNDGTLTSDPATVDISIAVSQVGDIATLTAVPGTNTAEVLVSWSAASDAGNYYVERSTLSNSGFVQVATVSAPTVSYTDTGLTLAQTYFYRVKAVNSGSVSNYSTVVSSLPNNPYGVVGTIDSITAVPGANPGEITVTWSATDNAKTYQVEFAANWFLPFAYRVVSFVQAPKLTYTHTGLPLGIDCYYRVKAYNPAYTGTYSASVVAKPYLPSTLAGWRYINFGTNSIISGVSGDLDSPSGDGVTNLMRCALGISLRDDNDDYLVTPPTSMPYVKEQTVNGSQYLTCSFTHNKTATDLVVKVEVTDDPSGTWTQLDPFDTTNQVSVTDNTPSDGIETIVVKDTQPISSATKRFMRVRVTHP